MGSGACDNPEWEGGGFLCSDGDDVGGIPGALAVDVKPGGGGRRLLLPKDEEWIILCPVE